MAEPTYWNRPKGAGANSTRRSQRGDDAKVAKDPRGRGLWRGAAALAIVLVGGGLVWWWVGGRDGASSTQRPQKGEDAKVAKGPDGRGERPARPAADAAERVPPATNAAVEVRRYGHSSNVPSSDPSRVRKAPAAGGMTVVGWDGKERVIKSKPIFASRADNMLWAAIRPGGMPSGLNALRSRMRHQTGSDEAFLAAIRRQDFAVEPDDPPHVKAAKEATKEVKERIVEEMEKGRTFDELFQEIRETTYKERMYERIAQEEMRRMVREGDAAAIRDYVRDMNPVMESMGLKTLRVPSWAEQE